MQRGADVNVAEPRGGQTALMWAAAEGHSDVVAGPDRDGRQRQRRVEVPVSRRLSSPSSRTTSASIKTLLAAGANPNVTLQSGAKPLIVAMQYRHTAAALALLDGGADFDVRDRAGNTTLHLAAQAGDLELVRALLAKGADPNARTPKSAAPAGRAVAGAADAGGRSPASRRR